MQAIQLRQFIEGYRLRGPWTTSCSMNFSLFQIEEKTNFYKKCLPYYMISIQKIFFEKKKMYKKLQFLTILFPHKKFVTDKRTPKGATF